MPLPTDTDQLAALRALVNVRAGVPKMRAASAEAVAKLAKLDGNATRAALDELVARGHVLRETSGRGAAYRASEAAAVELKPAPKARVRRPAAATVEDLRALEQRLLDRIDALERRLTRDAGPEPAPAAKPVDTGDLARHVPAALRELDARGRYGGLVPIPELRREIAGRVPGLGRDAFDAGLLALERAFKVDLKVANDPRAVADPTLGIEVPGRGLVYYAVAR